MKKKRYYLAYGSNLNKTQMAFRCPNAKAVGTAELEDYELLFKGSLTGSYLTIEKKKGSVVPVGVWETDSNDELSLDHYEGYPQFYYKKELEIILDGERKPKQAYIYIMHEDREFGIPSRYYMETCIEGYDDFGFDDEPLYEALRKSVNKTRENKNYEN